MHSALAIAAPLLVKPKDIEAYATTKLPTRHGEFTCSIFREDHAEGLREHVAMVVGDVHGENVLCRVHSACITSEVFGSLKCDCSDQLDLALRRIQHQGRGVVLYLQQEGRGIGLGNKIAAYRQQESGLDTVDANRVLGLPDDTRRYAFAANVLHSLGIESVELMTNNPAKVDGLQAAGMDIACRHPHVVEVGPHSAEYLATKRKRMGHVLPVP